MFECRSGTFTSLWGIRRPNPTGGRGKTLDDARGGETLHRLFEQIDRSGAASPLILP